jgi:hypothetical protein
LALLSAPAFGAVLSVPTFGAVWTFFTAPGVVVADGDCDWSTRESTFVRSAAVPSLIGGPGFGSTLTFPSVPEITVPGFVPVATAPAVLDEPPPPGPVAPPVALPPGEPGPPPGIVTGMVFTGVRLGADALTAPVAPPLAA